MSKVSASSDPLVQLKDQYQLREREADNRHREEISELRQAHRAELDSVRTEAQKRVQETQEEGNAKLNQRDLQYQKEIEALKGIYAKRLAETKKPG